MGRSASALTSPPRWRARLPSRTTRAEPPRCDGCNLKRMRLRRFALGLMSLGIAASVAVAPAAAKEGVHATLVPAIPADIRAGKTVDLSWRLFTFGPRGEHVPF